MSSSRISEAWEEIEREFEELERELLEELADIEIEEPSRIEERIGRLGLLGLELERLEKTEEASE